MISYRIHLHSFILILIAIFHLTLASPSPKRLTLYQWPLSSPSLVPTPTPLGEIEYDTSTNTGTFTPSTTSSSTASTGKEQEAVSKPGGLVRIGLLNHGEFTSSVVIDSALLLSSVTDATPKISLYLDRTGEPWHVEYTLSSPPSPPPHDQTSRFEIVIIPPRPGPSPRLNKPIPTGPDGKVPAPEIEKTFLQKYWWLILAGAFLVLGGGAGGNE